LSFIWPSPIRSCTYATLNAGRRTGEQRRNPLIYREHDGKYLIVASKGGSDAPPAWYLNLQAHPEVTVQVRGDVFAARARTATPQEKPVFWPEMTEVWPAYDEYQRKTEREIPVVVLERA
jgi:deazaflavin-dependent oxidoreductase (nitroreductase family)